MTKLSIEEQERYSRHLRIPGFDEVAQLRLRNGSVLVIGAGGLGSPALLYLAAAGVGRIGIADFDRVERHNLQRQILYADQQTGTSKANAAKARLQALNPEVEVVLHEEGIKPENAREIIRKYDVILDGSDNFATRYLINDATYLERKPLVYGSVFQYEGQVMVLNDSPDAPCYRCLFPDPPVPGTVPNCNEAGVVGALCGVVGSLQAMESIKLLTGIGQVMSGRLMKVDVFNARFPSIRLIKDPGCPLCGAHPEIRDIQVEKYSVPCALPDVHVEEPTASPMEIDIEEAKELVDSQQAYLLDIREADEVEICQIADSIYIPMGEIPHRSGEIPQDKPVIIYCHHGARSLRVSHYLRSKGHGQCCSLRGGIERWATRVDASMNRY
jgi:sulfur-carrier protein adenylyltransferase/sulfurtransferase